MPGRRGGRSRIFERAMSRSKRLHGFETSSALGFRQAHTHRPAVVTPVYELPNKPSGSIAF